MTYIIKWTISLCIIIFMDYFILFICVVGPQHF